MRLEEVSLKDFVDIYFGDYSILVGSEEEKLRQASDMCLEYFQIVGGKQVSVQVAKRDKILRIEMRSACLEVCECLLTMGEVSSAIAVMASMGYKVTEKEIRDKIANIRRMDAYALKKMENEKSESEELTREHFIRERCFIMGHLKMHIDEHVFKAKEYAYLVKQVNEEIESMVKAKRK